MPFPSPFLIGGMAQVPLTFRGPAGALLQEGAQRGLPVLHHRFHGHGERCASPSVPSERRRGHHEGGEHCEGREGREIGWSIVKPFPSILFSPSPPLLLPFPPQYNSSSCSNSSVCTECLKHSVTSFLIPDALLFVSYLYALYIFRFSEPEYLQMLTQTVSPLGGQ